MVTEVWGGRGLCRKCWQMVSGGGFVNGRTQRIKTIPFHQINFNTYYTLHNSGFLSTSIQILLDVFCVYCRGYAPRYGWYHDPATVVSKSIIYTEVT